MQLQTLLKSLAVVFVILFSNNIYANNTPRCNVNKECPFGFVCLAGSPNSTGNDGYTAKDGDGKLVYTGYCAATVPLRQACYFHKILTGLFGKAITALALIMLALQFVEGKLDMKKIATFFFAVVMLFGSFEVVYFIINERYRSCEVINFNVPLGFPPEYENVIIQQ
jgi:hypothetical protein